MLNVIGAYDLGRGWRAGARFYYYTGRPYSRRVFGYTIPPFNEERFPDFYRIDARIEKAWRVGEKGRIAFVARMAQRHAAQGGDERDLRIEGDDRSRRRSPPDDCKFDVHRSGHHPELRRRGRVLDC